MTIAKKLASCLFALILGTSLAFLPVVALADETPNDKGIADQFAEVDDAAADDPANEVVEAADETEAEAAQNGNEGLSAGEDATGAWQQEAAPDNYVFDEYGLFSADQLATLEQKAEQLASQYNMGVYFLATDTMNGNYNPTSDERTKFATKYYMDNSLGLGSGKDGIMFVVAVDSRDYVTIAYGQGSYEFSNEGISAMEDDVTEYLGDNKWFEAANAYYNDIGDQLAYYAKHGKPGKPLGLFDYVIRFAIILLIPLIIASMVTGGWKRAMLTAKEKSEARDYLDQSSLVLTASSDTFINSSVVATPRADDNKSGGGGGWGGGGGGGFSSSGGGKF